MTCVHHVHHIGEFYLKSRKSENNMLILIGIICGFAFENVCIIMTMTMTMTIIIIIIIIIILFFFSTYIHIHIHQYTYHTYISMHIHIYVCLPQNKDYQKTTYPQQTKTNINNPPSSNPLPHLTDLIRSLFIEIPGPGNDGAAAIRIKNTQNPIQLGGREWNPQLS